MMTKKILFLLTFLLTTIGGGNFALAESVTFNTTSGNLTSPLDEISLTYSGADLFSDQLKVKKGDSFTISTSSRFIQSIEMTLMAKPSAPQYVTANVGSTAYDDTNIKYTWTGIAKSIVFTNANEEAARDFRIVSVTVTYTTTDPSSVNDETVQTYPYTWDFTSGSSLWETSLEELELFTAQWSDDTTTGDYRPTTARTTDWGFNISILKGLRFNPVSVSNSPGLDYNWKHLWIAAGTTITIPSVKAGQKIQLTGTVYISGKSSNLTQVTENSEYTVNANGDATLTFNDSWIHTISVTKIPQTLSFDAPSYTINYGVTGVSHTATLSPTTGATINYSSSDPNVATVNESGVITTVNSGTCEITATAAETETYDEATASYKLTVNGTQTPTIAWNATSELTESGGVWTAQDLPYGNHKFYTANVLDADGSGVTSDAIRYGLVEGYEGYLTIDSNTGKIEPTRKFADESLTEKVVQVYAYIPGSGTRNPAPRIIYNVKIVKGTFSGDLFKQTELTVNAGCTIAPQNNVQSMNWNDIDAITVVITDGSSDNAVSGSGTEMVSDYKADTSNKTLYFDTKMKNDIEIVDWFYPVFHGKAVGDVTFTVTLKSKLYGDQSGDFTLHVIAADQSTGFAWASATRKYTIYEGDYMLLPEISGSTNGNFSYSVGAANQSTHHKYVYTRRWDGSQYVTTYNNKNFHKGEGFPNFDLTSDDAGNTVVTSVDASGNNVALLFWNTGSGTENDRLLIYGNKAGTVYLKAFDPQITTRALDIIEIEVKSKEDIEDDFESLKSGMTFPYTWDFTTNYDWSTEIETGTGNWVENNGSYNLGMSSNINYDYADEDKNEIVWGNDNNDPTTNSNELTSKLFVGQNNKVLRGFAGMKIKLGNNGSGSWYSKRDGIRILPYTSSNTPRLSVVTGTHTLILPTPTGANCPATFKVFVKAKARAAGDGTLWVRKANIDRNASGQNSYYNFKNAAVGDDIIYSVDATKDTPLELDLDKVDIYWIAYSTEANNTAKPTANTTLTYAATSYSYGKALDLAKSEEVNNGLTAYYASTFTNGLDAASAVTLRQVTLDQNGVRANTGLVLKSNNPSTNYMIADAENQDSYSEPTALGTNYLVAGTGSTVSSTTGSGDNIKTNFILSYAYKKFADDGTTAMTGYQYNRDWSFYKVMPSATVPVGKAYLQVDGNLRVKSDGTIETITPSGSRRAADGSDDDRPANKLMLDIVYEDEAHGFDATTAINDVKTDTVTVDDDAWYTLQGVRVNTPARGGIYIHNGRKVVIK